MNKRIQFPLARAHLAQAMLSVGLVAAANSAVADLRQAIADGETALGLRYRYEQVDQDGFDKMAKASTAKARLTWNSAQTGALSFGIEADYSFVVGIEQFNSTTNGLTQYPVIADPPGFDLNQAFIKYAGDNSTLTFGRQRINHGSQRLLGGVAWRQNEQTYDAVRVQADTGVANVDYAFIHNINRIFGPGDGVQPGDWYGNTHAARVTFQPADDHKVALFGYLIDLQNANGPPNSNATFGLDYEGQFDQFKLNAAIGRQSDWADNPTSYDVSYYSIQGSVKLAAATFTGAYEVLGSDGGEATFRAPVATLHKFQGWTDKFLIPPPTGVRDVWFSVAGQVLDANVSGVYHRFTADDGGADYGSEIGVSVVKPISDYLSFQFKAARYSADEHATDTTKVWVVFNWQW